MVGTGAPSITIYSSIGNDYWDPYVTPLLDGHIYMWQHVELTLVIRYGDLY